MYVHINSHRRHKTCWLSQPLTHLSNRPPVRRPLPWTSISGVDSRGSLHSTRQYRPRTKSSVLRSGLPAEWMVRNTSCTILMYFIMYTHVHTCTYIRTYVPTYVYMYVCRLQTFQILISPYVCTRLDTQV